MEGQTNLHASGNDWIALHNEGVELFNAGRPAEAEERFRRVAELRPDTPSVWHTLGSIRRMLGRLNDAYAAFLEGLRRDGGNRDLLLGVGQVLIDGGRPQDALPHLQRLVAQRFDHPGAMLALGNAFMGVDTPELAAAAYRLVVLLEPDSATATNNLGAALMSQLRMEDAARIYRRAIRLAPSSPEYHKNLGCCLLMAGEFAEGWREYEWRHEQPVWRWKRSFPGKQPWSGEPLAGKTILVHFEQGLGDSFQLARCMRVLKGMGARVVFECQPQLKRVLSCVEGIDVLVGHGEPLPDFDLYVPLFSVPRWLGVTAETVPGGVPYIRPEPELVAKWRARMDLGEFRVGVNWEANGPERSIPLELFERMAGIPGVRLYSLQKVKGLEQLERLRDRLGIVDWTAEMDAGPDGFVDTAAVMANMDLVISCDTAVNHLSGALGLRTFLVLRHLGDWRWIRPERLDTPWYPTMRLFRMARRNDWAEVMGRVTDEVARLAAEEKPAAGR
ncbi:tetratricopeptide repeat protein [Azospirillum sp.]|uniref:tetratricopeptide repeat protein n=1 Tax=Azospirillum sp. TaxID=34012 RepID=UPI003D7073DB